jgi:hypothetical protein
MPSIRFVGAGFAYDGRDAVLERLDRMASRYPV